jgi:DNA-directed RNA polymerase
MNTTTTQKNLAQEMVDIGVTRYRNKIASAKDRKSEATISYGQRLMREACKPLFTAIVDWQTSIKKIQNKAKFQKHIAELSNKNLEKIAYLTLKVALDGLTEVVTFTSLSYRIGRTIEDQLMAEFIVKNMATGEGKILGAKRMAHRGPQGVRKFMRGVLQSSIRDGEIDAWDDWAKRDKISCGAYLIQLLQKATGLIEYKMIIQPRRKQPTRFVVASQQTLDWVNEYNLDRELLQPFWLPMLECPKPWDSIWNGGYDIEDAAIPILPFIKTPDRKWLREKHEIQNVYDAVNYIQETPYKINNEILEVFDWAWENNTLIGLPNKEDVPLPPQPERGTLPEEQQKELNKLRKETSQHNNAMQSRRLLIGKIQWLAHKMKDQRMFFPSNVDFRGRVYQIPSFLNYQGPDHCRGLLTFARGVKIKSDEDLKWLAIHGANSFGYDKVTYAKRIKWAEEYTVMAQRIANDPLSNREWADADSPWQFLAWCKEWAGYHSKDSKNFLSYLPCSMDATNNGLQILSLLARDEFGAEATNVMPTDTPADIYGVVAEQVKLALTNDAELNKPFAYHWLKFGVDRDCTKRPVMCYSYGLTSYSNRQYIADWYLELTKNGKGTPFIRSERYQAIQYLADLVWNAIEQVLTKPKEIMAWFQDIAKITARDKNFLQWTSPSGFQIRQDYKKTQAKRIKTWLNGEGKYLKFYDEIDAMDISRQSNGASPNIVHSLDAAALHETVKRCKEQHNIHDFAMIHDSYGTHSTNCEVMGKVLREVFVDIFSENFLANFRDEIQSLNPSVELPSVPALGNLDVSSLLKSEYFFS